MAARVHVLGLDRVHDRVDGRAEEELEVDPPAGRREGAPDAAGDRLDRLDGVVWELGPSRVNVDHAHCAARGRDHGHQDRRPVLARHGTPVRSAAGGDVEGQRLGEGQDLDLAQVAADARVQLAGLRVHREHDALQAAGRGQGRVKRAGQDLLGPVGVAQGAVEAVEEQADLVAPQELALGQELGVDLREHDPRGALARGGQAHRGHVRARALDSARLLAQLEHESRRADPDRVAVAEVRGPVLPPVQEGAVGRLHVVDRELTRLVARDLGVDPAHGGVVEHDRVLGVAAECDRVRRELEESSRVGTLGHVEHGEQGAPPGRSWSAEGAQTQPLEYSGSTSGAPGSARGAPPRSPPLRSPRLPNLTLGR